MKEKKKIILGGGLFLFLIAGLVAGLVLVSQRQIIQKRAGGTNTSLTMPTTINVLTGQNFEVPIFINTDNNNISGVDVVLNYVDGKQMVDLVDIIPNASTATTLKTFIPADANGVFEKQTVITKANTTGKVELGAVIFDWATMAVLNPFNGSLAVSNPLATLVFRAKTAGTINFSWGNDSHLVSFESGENILTTKGSLTVTIGSTITPTLTPTLTPTVMPTVTPTPTTGITKATLNFKVKFQGINTQKANKTVNIVLKQGTAEKYRFDNTIVTADVNGNYAGTVSNINPDTYEVMIKGWSHLQKKIGGVNLVTGVNTLDWSSMMLKPGDFDNNNILNIIDISAILAGYTQLAVPVDSANKKYDVDGSETIDINDISIVLSNYTALEVEGEN